MTKEERIKKHESYIEKVSRKGMDKLTDWLLSSDFFTAPASTRFHSNYEGGLFDHVSKVTQFALLLNRFCNERFGNEKVSEESIIIAGLYHDLCKVDFYHKEEKWTKPANRWVSYMGYTAREKFPLGHGEKSLWILSRYIELTDAEVMAIRWHMGFWIKSSHSGYPEGPAIQQAMAEYPLVRVIQNADACASMVEKTIDYKQKAEEGRRV